MQISGSDLSPLYCLLRRKLLLMPVAYTEEQYGVGGGIAVDPRSIAQRILQVSLASSSCAACISLSLMS